MGDARGGVSLASAHREWDAIFAMGRSIAQAWSLLNQGFSNSMVMTTLELIQIRLDVNFRRLEYSFQRAASRLTQQTINSWKCPQCDVLSTPRPYPRRHRRRHPTQHHWNHRLQRIGFVQSATFRLEILTVIFMKMINRFFCPVIIRSTVAVYEHGSSITHNARCAVAAFQKTVVVVTFPPRSQQQVP